MYIVLRIADMAEMQAIMEKYGTRMEQIMKLAQYPDLMEAYTRAMTNTG